VRCRFSLQFCNSDIFLATASFNSDVSNPAVDRVCYSYLKGVSGQKTGAGGAVFLGFFFYPSNYTFLFFPSPRPCVT
jgi:hypothetical protein